MKNKTLFDCELCGAPDYGGGIGGWSVHHTLWIKVMKEESIRGAGPRSAMIRGDQQLKT